MESCRKIWGGGHYFCVLVMLLSLPFILPWFFSVYNIFCACGNRRYCIYFIYNFICNFIYCYSSFRCKFIYLNSSTIWKFKIWMICWTNPSQQNLTVEYQSKLNQNQVRKELRSLVAKVTSWSDTRIWVLGSNSSFDMVWCPL